MDSIEQQRWQRDLAEMEILLLTLGLTSWIAFWACVHYKIIALV